MNAADAATRLPRTCGDRPTGVPRPTRREMAPPYMRGWTPPMLLLEWVGLLAARIFPDDGRRSVRLLARTSVHLDCGVARLGAAPMAWVMLNMLRRLRLVLGAAARCGRAALGFGLARRRGCHPILAQARPFNWSLGPDSNRRTTRRGSDSLTDATLLMSSLRLRSQTDGGTNGGTIRLPHHKIPIYQ